MQHYWVEGIIIATGQSLSVLYNTVFVVLMRTQQAQAFKQTQGYVYIYYIYVEGPCVLRLGLHWDTF